MIKIVKTGGKGHPFRYREFLISSSTDVADLPTAESAVAPGSLAYTQDLAHTYLVGPDGVWREV